MKVLFGRPGFADSPAGRRIHELEPDWELVSATGDDFVAATSDADIVCPISASVTASALEGGRVKMVQQFGVGTDSIDLEGARALGVTVANLPGDTTGNADSVAELAVYFVLALVRRVEEARAAARDGRFESRPAPSVFGRRILVVGLGAIGAAVGARLAPFGADLVGIRADPAKGGVLGIDEVHGPDALHAELARADVVVLCAPAGPEGAPLFDRAAFAAVKPGAALVNVARGALVDEDALLDALEAGVVSGAGLDVTVEEPPRAGHPLVAHPAVIVTPHVAGATRDSLVASAERFVENVRRLDTAEGPRWVRN